MSDNNDRKRKPTWAFDEPGPSKQVRYYNWRGNCQNSEYSGQRFGQIRNYNRWDNQNSGYSDHRFYQTGNKKSRKRGYDGRFRNLPSSSTPQKHIVNSKKTSTKSKDPERLSLKFEKRRGTTYLGNLYEEYIPVSVTLTLLQNKDVRDFRISTNDYEFGNFDDFILEIDYNSGTTEKYAIQLKHKQNFTLTPENLKKDKNFDILNYYQKFQDCGQLLSEYKVILFTNAKFIGDSNIVFNLEDGTDRIKVRLNECVASSVINTSENGKSYKFQIEPENSEEIKQKYMDFFERFFLYSNQMNVHQLKSDIPKSFLELTKSCAAHKFLKFISEWSLTEGIKDKLTKEMIIKVITLHIVEELIQPHTFCEVDEKKKLFQSAISHFNITTFSNNSLENVVKIWGDAKSRLYDRNIEEINEIIKQFQICTNIENIDDLSDEESTRLLWVMDECPLILKDGPAAYEAAKLCGEKSKFVFMTDELHEEKLEQLTVFKTLSDLKRHKSSTYNDIVKNFAFKLFGEETSFEELIKENDDFENLITTNEIAQVTDKVDIIKLEEEKLCFPYVERHLYKNTIDFKYLQKLDEETMVVISNVSDVKKLRSGLQNFEIVSIMDELHKDTYDSGKEFQISDNTFSKKTGEEFDSQFKREFLNFEGTDIRKDKKMNQGNSLTKHKLVFNKTETSLEEFTSFCNKNRKYQRFHHLRYHDEYFEWIKSTDGVSDLQFFSTRSDSVVDDEERYADNVSHNVNIVIGDPGMGKSLFLKKLKNNLLSKYLPVMVLPTDVPTLCKCIEDPKNLQKFFDCILKSKFGKFGNLEKQVIKLLMKKGKAVFLWDALDELSDKNKKFVEELMKTLSENSVLQFVTSRAFLRKQLEHKFNVLSRELQPFNDKQQSDYIRKRLQDKCSTEELEPITTAIKENIADTSYRDILGIPLQIHMLTELFRQDLAKYKKILCDFFVITDLYFNFIDEKFNFHFKVKRNYPTNYREDGIIEETLSRRIENYQQVALQSIFGTAFSMESNKEFLNKIKEKGDEFGLITAVDINMRPEFLHNSYAEYFAANYLAENCRSIPNLDLIFDRRYTNVKYFFDLLLAKNSPAHIAVLCKNLKYFQDFSSKDEMKLKDLQGRSALHLAASCGERYPLLEVMEINKDSIYENNSTLSHKLKEYDISIFGGTILINDNINYETKKENSEYFQIMGVLLENCDPNEKDELLKFTPTMYAEKNECFIVAALIEVKVESKSDLGIEREKFIYSVLYYAIKHHFVNIINLFDDLKLFMINTENGNSILHMAVANNRLDYLRKLITQKVYKENINYQNLFGRTALMLAAQNGYIEAVKYLKEQNAKIDVTDKNGFTPLILAVSRGHFEIVKYLIKQNAKVDVTDENGFTPLMVAAQNGHLETAKYLIQQNADVNAAANKGQTPLFLAAMNGHLEIVKYLKEHNANVDTVSIDGGTPLMMAAQNSHLETVKYLKEQNAKLDAADKDGFTPLMVAAQNGHLDMVKHLIQQNPNVNAAANQGQTPLYLAARNGHLETVKYLKEQNAKIDTVDLYGGTPLIKAAENGHLETVKYLKEQNAKVDAAANDGFTPLMVAAQNGHLDTVKYLIQQNANVNAAANHGQTPLYQAARNGHFEIVKYLKEQNAKVDAVDIYDGTPLMKAAENGHLETVEYLKEQNAKDDVRDKNGYTPLMLAALNGYLNTVEYLIQQNADVNATANQGQTALSLAALNGHLEIVKYLKEQNANVNVADKNGFTPLMLAVSKGHLEIVEYLKEQNAKIDVAVNSFIPLMVAAQNGHVETVKYLIQQNGNVNAANSEGQTPLFLAAVNGHLDTVKYLIQEHANVNAADNDGFTPLMGAVDNGHLDTVKYLIQQNANVNAADNEGQTPLLQAARNGHFEMAKYLKEQNAKVDTVDIYGGTPLMRAARNGHLETVKYLKEQNAKVDVADNIGFTPLMLAALNGYLDTVEYLIQQNANVNAAANSGYTSLYLAASHGHLETVKYLMEQNAKIDAADNKDGFTPLMGAAEYGHLDTVKYLIQQNANVNAAANQGQTALHLAAQNGHLETVNYLQMSMHQQRHL